MKQAIGSSMIEMRNQYICSFVRSFVRVFRSSQPSPAQLISFEAHIEFGPKKLLTITNVTNLTDWTGTAHHIDEP